VDEELSIIQEINEELKDDRQMAFLKKHQNTILSVIAVAVVGIIIYSSMHERKKRNMEEITNALVEIIKNPEAKGDLTISGLLEYAPAELVPILTIMKTGRRLMVGDFAEENLRQLRELSEKHGVDLIWKDLALIIYASYPTESPENLIKLLTPLTGKDRPFRFTAMEFIGMMHENEGRHQEAVECLEKILGDEKAAETLKNRVLMMANYIKNRIEEEKNMEKK
jgi:hypothetical protein